MSKYMRYQKDLGSVSRLVHLKVDVAIVGSPMGTESVGHKDMTRNGGAEGCMKARAGWYLIVGSNRY
jgi:hypothetical protein